MRKILFLLLQLLFVTETEAQIVVNVQMPQAGVYLNSQLWNMTIINAGNTTADIRIDMLLSDAASADPILSGSSREFLLPVGPKQIQITDLIPIQYNLINSQYGASANADGFLPVGEFTICFSIFRRNGETYEKVAEECENILVEPASPPILIYPEDEGLIAENRPLFTWLPPMPQFLFSSLSYKLTLVEVMGNQQPEEAVQQNLPLLQQDNIEYSFLPYPNSLPSLDTGKLYAWRIQAYNGFQAVSNSEVFSFHLATEYDTIRMNKPVYTLLRQPQEMKLTIAKQKLYYEFVNAVNVETIQLEVVDISNPKSQYVNLPQTIVNVKPGQNFLEIELHGLSGMITNHIYQLNVTSGNMQPLALKFIYQSAE